MASSISGIGPMSMNPISAIRPREIRPQNYAVENESEISDAFSESLEVNGANGITGPAPVQYTNAQATEFGGSGQRSSPSAARVSQFYNQVASSFQGAPTSYDAGGNAGQYAMIGSNIDLAV